MRLDLEIGEHVRALLRAPARARASCARCCFSSSASFASSAASSAVELARCACTSFSMSLISPGARAAEIAVVDEHAPGERRVLLVEQQLQGLLAADEVGRAHLPGERGAVLGELRLARRASRWQGRRAARPPRLRSRRTSSSAPRACRRPTFPRRAAPGEAVALDLLGAHLAGDALDLRLDRLQLRLGLPGVRFRAGGRRQPGRLPVTASATSTARQSRRRTGRKARGAIMRALFRPRHPDLPHGSSPRISQPSPLARPPRTALVAALVVVYEMRARSEGQVTVSPQDLIRLMNQGALVLDLRAAGAVPGRPPDRRPAR